MRTLVCSWRENGDLAYWSINEFNNFYLYIAAQAFKAEADRRHFNPVTESQRIGYTFRVDDTSEPIVLTPDDSIVVVTLEGDRDPMTYDYSLGRPVGAGELWMLTTYLAQPHQMVMAQQHIAAQQRAAADAQLRSQILAGTKPV